MLPDFFCCPVCKGRLLTTPAGFRCEPCARGFETVAGIPDFFISESENDFIDDPNRTWLDPEIVEARDTVYRLCHRELRGMAFSMDEIGRRTKVGCRVLEVGMGTGHFTRWLAEVSEPGTRICAFDFSWPIIEKAKANTLGLSGLTLFRANARGALPFRDGVFDIVFVRLAPLGPHGVPNVKAGYELLKPGGWYFSARWEQERFETPPTEWAIGHGFESAEHHEWQYPRLQTEEEHVAMQIEQERLSVMKGGGLSVGRTEGMAVDAGCCQGRGEGILKMTQEHVLIAHKPAERPSYPR